MITIDVQNREVLDYLHRLINRMDDISPVMDAIGQRLEEHISMRFETESDPAGREWAPWKPVPRARGDEPLFELLVLDDEHRSPRSRG